MRPWYEEACDHRWVDSGEPFKTYARSEQGPNNPLRQAQKCPRCDEVRVVIISTKRETA